MTRSTADATLGSCTTWVEWLRHEMEGVPSEVAIVTPKVSPPVVPTGLHPWLGFRMLVYFDAHNAQHLSSELGFDPASLELLSERLEGLVRRFAHGDRPDEPVPGVDLVGDATAHVLDLVALLGSVDAVETRTKVSMTTRLAFRRTPEEARYRSPPTTPVWVVGALHRWQGEGFVADEVSGAFDRVSGACTTVGHLAARQTYGGKPKQEAEVLQGLADCDCEGVDREAFAGLLLGISRYRSPYGVWPIARKPGPGVRRIAMPRSATIADLAIELAKDPSGAPFYVEILP